MLSTKSNFFLLLFTLIVVLNLAVCGTMAPSLSASRHTFSKDIFRTIAPKHLDENVIYSPASIQACLTLAFMGANGHTSDELRNGLRLGDQPKTVIAKNYADFIKHSFGSQKKNGPILKMANNVYLNQALDFSTEFSKIASNDFGTKVEKLNFGDSSKAVNKINSWVEQQTNNKIRNLLQADSVNDETSSILVNAIYFKGLWKSQFSESSTSQEPFFTDANNYVLVDMMFNDDRYKYAELPELDATVLALPYENSDLHMMIILPNKKDGLKALESKLADVDLNEISSKLKDEDVEVHLPKFKIEFDIDLKQPLRELGMKSMFEDDANFTALFKGETPRQKVSDVKHKAFLEVNEAGSEASAATFLKIVPMSLNLNQKSFRVNNPFVFAILDSKAVYFAGHVAKL